jgi:FkbM family methyltransferase
MWRSLIVKCIKSVRPLPRDDMRHAIQWIVARKIPRRILNVAYAWLPKAAFHLNFDDIFRDYQGRFDDGTWTSSFDCKSIKMPLRKATAWLDWDLATSVLGQDFEIKQTYESFLRFQNPPQLVLDIGASYGTHSLPFLAHRLKVISFEPNPKCHAFFREVCALNHFSCDIEATAAADRDGETTLWFPETMEWMGTTLAHVKDTFEPDTKIFELKVPQITIDEYLQRHKLKADLIKIDTEGNELTVLTGCRRMLTELKPVIIFEAWPGPERRRLIAFFTEHQYAVCGLPAFVHPPPIPMTLTQFDNSEATNFMAVALTSLGSWPAIFAK